MNLPPGSQTFELGQSFSGQLLLPVSDFHTIKPASGKLAPQRPAVALTSTETSADPKGGETVECQLGPIHFAD
eukprot:9136372-Lingulodinium_polyedra.AAC.1